MASSLANLDLSPILAPKRPKFKAPSSVETAYAVQNALQTAQANESLSQIDQRALAGDKGAKAARGALDRILQSPYVSEGLKKRAKSYYETQNGDLDESFIDSIRDTIGDLFGKGLTAIDKPKRAVVATEENILSALGVIDKKKGQSWVDRVLHDEEFGYGDVLREVAEQNPDLPGAGVVSEDRYNVASGLGLIGDVASDPLSYVGTGVVAAGAKGVKEGSAAAKAAGAVESASRVADQVAPAGRKALRLTKRDVQHKAGQIAKSARNSGNIEKAEYYEGLIAKAEHGLGKLSSKEMADIGVRGGLKVGSRGPTIVPWAVTRHAGAPFRALDEVTRTTKWGRRIFSKFGEGRLNKAREILRDPKARGEDKANAVLGIDAIRHADDGRRFFAHSHETDLRDILAEAQKAGVDDLDLHAAVNGDEAARARVADKWDGLDRLTEHRVLEANDVNTEAGRAIVSEELGNALPLVLRDETMDAIKAKSTLSPLLETADLRSLYKGMEILPKQFLGSKELTQKYGKSLVAQAEGVIREIAPELDEIYELDGFKALVQEHYSNARIFGEVRGENRLRELGVMIEQGFRADPDVQSDILKEINAIQPKFSDTMDELLKTKRDLVQVAKAIDEEGGLKGAILQFRSNIKVLREAEREAEKAYDLARAARNAKNIPTHNPSMADAARLAAGAPSAASEHARGFRDLGNRLLDMLGRGPEASLKGWTKTGGTWPNEYLAAMEANPEALAELHRGLREMFGDGPIQVVRRGNQTGTERGIINGSVVVDWGGAGGSKVRTYSVLPKDIVGIGSGPEGEVFFRAEKALASKVSTVEAVDQAMLERMKREVLRLGNDRREAIRQLGFLKAQAGEVDDDIIRRIGTVQAESRGSLAGNPIVDTAYSEAEGTLDQATEAGRIYNDPENAYIEAERRLEQRESALDNVSPRNERRAKAVASTVNHSEDAVRITEMMANPALDEETKYSLGLLASYHEAAARMDELGRVAMNDDEMLGYLKSRQGMKTIQDVIARGYVQFGKDFEQVPSYIQSAMLRSHAELSHPEGLLKAYDAFIRGFKTYAILTPGFPVRNSFGAFFSNYVAGIDTASYTEFGKWFKKYQQGWVKTFFAKGQGGGIKALEDAKAPQQVIDIFKQMETKGQFADANRVVGEVAADINPEIGASRGRPLSNWWLTRNMRSLNERVEQYHRGALMYDTLKKAAPADFQNGNAFAMGLERVYKFHFDYSDLSDFETNVVRRVVPFWVWTSRNLPLQLEQIARNPRMYERFNQVRDNFGQDDRGMLVPDYIRKSPVAIYLNKDLPVVGHVDYLTPDLPFNSVPEQLTNIASLNPAAVLGPGSSPAARLPFELYFNQQFFGDIPLSDKLEPAPGNWTKVPGLMEGLKVANLAERHKDGTWLMSNKNLYVLNSILPTIAQSRRLLPSEDKYNSRWMGAISSFFGFGSRNISEVDKTNAAYGIADVLQRAVAQQRELGRIEAAT